MGQQTELAEYTKFLILNHNLLNNAEIARRLRMDKAALSRVITGKKDANGNPAKIPERCLPDLKILIKELNFTLFSMSII